MAVTAAATATYYLDFQMIDEFIDVAQRGLGGRWNLPSLLLDADRRAIGARALGVAIINAARVQVQTVDSAEFRAAVLRDLAEVAAKWGFQDVASDALLDRVIPLTGAVDVASEEMAWMLWLETVGSLALEGYSLEWVARRAARLLNKPWATVLTDADDIIVRRRSGNLQTWGAA